MANVEQALLFYVEEHRWKEVSWDQGLEKFRPMRDHAALQVTNQMMERKLKVRVYCLVQYLSWLFEIELDA